MGFPGGGTGLEYIDHGKSHKTQGTLPWVGKIPWRRE